MIQTKESAIANKQNRKNHTKTKHLWNTNGSRNPAISDLFVKFIACKGGWDIIGVSYFVKFWNNANNELFRLYKKNTVFCVSFHKLGWLVNGSRLMTLV